MIIASLGYSEIKRRSSNVFGIDNKHIGLN